MCQIYKNIEMIQKKNNRLNNIVFFDGVCNLCNRSVQFLIRKDSKQKFLFASLQSNFAQNFFMERNFKTKSDSVIFFTNNQFYEKSTAFIMIMSELGGFFKLFTILYVVPKFLRNKGYDMIARNRYSWFGKKDSCMLASTDLKNRFLE